MTKALSVFIFCGLASQAVAGVVFEIEVIDPRQDGAAPDRLSTTLDGKNIKMNVSGPRGADSDMVYRGDRREMLAIDHEGQRYFLIDDAMIDQIGTQLADIDAQIEAALKDVPAEQRPMMEQMIKQQMEQVMASAPPVPEIDIRNTGETADKNGFPCVKHELYRDGVLSKVFWVTEWDNVEGGQAARAAFEDMARFIKDLQAALPDFAQSPETGNNAYENLDDLGGFPVVTLEFSQSGVQISESHLRSSEEKDVDPSVFEPPAGYTRQTVAQ